MTPAETIQLVGLVCMITPMKLEEHTADAWHLMLGDEDFGLHECKAAAVALAKRQTFIAPNEVITEVKARRKASLAAAGMVGAGMEAAVPVDEHGRPVDPDDVRAYNAALRAGRLGIASGMRDRSAAMAALVGQTRKQLALPAADVHARAQEARRALPPAKPREGERGFSEAIVEMDRLLAEQRAAAVAESDAEVPADT